MILKSREFTFLMVTRFLVTFSTQIQAVAVGWLVYTIKQDPLYLGLIGLTEAAPALGFALLSGWMVDRGKPLTFYRWAIAGSALSAIILTLVASDTVPLAPTPKLVTIFFAAVVTGLARSFIGPSQFSILPLTVSRGDLGQAAAWNTSLNQIAALSGPALGGFIYALGGGRETFLFISVLLIIAFFSAAQIKRGNLSRPPLVKVEGLSEGLLSGVQFVRHNQVVLAALSLDMFAVFFGGATALFPIFARDIFANGPMGLGILRAAMPIGSFLMGWYLIYVPISKFTGKVMLWAFVGFGLSMLGFGLSTSFPLSCFLLVVTGMCDSVSVVVRHTILQMMTPVHMRGRVASVSAIFIGSSNEIGAFESGVAAKLLGTRASVVFGAIVTLLVVGLTWRLAPKLRKLDLGNVQPT